MKTKFVELFQIYKYGILKKIVAQKHLPHQGVFHTNIEKYYWRTLFSYESFSL